MTNLVKLDILRLFSLSFLSGLQMLELMNVKWQYLSKDLEEAKKIGEYAHIKKVK